MEKTNRILSERLLNIGNRPPHSTLVVPISGKSIDELTKFTDLMYFFGTEVVSLYYAGNPLIKYFVEYGLPDIYLELLRASKSVAPHKALFRFDFFFSENGPKLIEISSNPWGLLSYEDHVRRHTSNREHFPASDIYHQLCTSLSGSRIGIWRNFGFSDDIAAIVSNLKKLGITADPVNQIEVLRDYDGIFYDIETAYFDGTLPSLLPHANRLLPSPVNEIIKRKNLLTLAYQFSTGRMTIAFCSYERGKKLSGEVPGPSILGTRPTGLHA